MVDMYWGVDLDAPISDMDKALNSICCLGEGGAGTFSIGHDMTVWVGIMDGRYHTMVCGPSMDSPDENGAYRFATLQMVEDYIDSSIGRRLDGVDADIAGWMIDISSIVNGTYHHVR